MVVNRNKYAVNNLLYSISTRRIKTDLNYHDNIWRYNSCSSSHILNMELVSLKRSKGKSK